jgi:glycosyltransferase involved in cell wall biosynthesis
MKIGFSSTDWGRGEIGELIPGGSNWYRITMPSQKLAEIGMDTTSGLLTPSVKMENLCGIRDYINTNTVTYGFDTIVIQQYMDKEVIPLFNRSKANGQNIVTDLDDWFWGLDLNNRAYTMTDPKLYPQNNRNHFWDGMRNATLITCSTEPLAQLIRKKLGGRGPEVLVIRNGVDLEAFTLKGVRNTNKPILGWVGGLPWRSGDFLNLGPIFRQFCNDYDLNFHHSGVVPEQENTPEAWIGNLGDRLNIKKTTGLPLMDIYKYPEMFIPIEVGIVPLRHSPFNDSKSFLKGLEYAASGIPFIATPSPEYKLLYELGCGILAEKPKDWLRELKKMLDPDWRNEVREKNLKVVQELTIQNRILEWKDMLLSL